MCSRISEEFLILNDVCDKNDLSKELENCLSKDDCVVFLDLCQGGSAEGDAVHLVRLCSRFVSYCVIATSSSAGKQFVSSNESRMVSLLSKFKEINFKPFTKDEGVLFVESSCSVKDFSAYRFVKQMNNYAGRNPYLFCKAVSKVTHIGVSELQKSKAVCTTLTENFLKETFPEHLNNRFLKFDELLQLFHDIK